MLSVQPGRNNTSAKNKVARNVCFLPYTGEKDVLSPAVLWWDMAVVKLHKPGVPKCCFTLLPLVIWMKIKKFLKSLPKQPFSLPTK